MWYALVIFQTVTGLLYPSLGSLKCSWDVLGDPFGVLWQSLGVLGGPLDARLGSLAVLGGSSGGPSGSLGRSQTGPRIQKVVSKYLGVWGALGVIVVFWRAP